MAKSAPRSAASCVSWMVSYVEQAPVPTMRGTSLREESASSASRAATTTLFRSEWVKCTAGDTRFGSVSKRGDLPSIFVRHTLTFAHRAESDDSDCEYGGTRSAFD